MKYAFFLGCLIPARELSYETSVRRTMPELGVELVDMKASNCCAPFSIQSVDYDSWLALAARDLCIAEEMGMDIMTLCNDCYESLLMVNNLLKKNPELKDRANNILSEVGKEFKGKVDVKNLVDVLYGDVGIDKVKNAIKEPFNGLKVGAQPGCHLTKPKRIHFELLRGFNELDALVNATGAESVPYERKEMCCGGPLRDINDDLSRSISREKLRALKDSEVQAVTTVCPFCFLQLDLGQLEVKRHFNEEYNLPVVHFIELLRMSMGMKLEDWEIKAHRIPITDLFKGRL
jgi:heterodisulfide reductase subunit B